MTRATHFPFYPSDWLGGVAGMKPAEVGVYINIIAMIYDAGGPIKLDEARLARRMCCPLVTFRAILDALVDDEKLTIRDGFVSQLRAEIELEKLGQKRLSASASAASRWQEKPNKTTGEGMRTHSERNANQNQSQNHKKDIDKSISKEKRGTRISEDWKPSQDDFNQALQMGLTVEQVDNEANKFRDYWIGVPGAKGVKLNWSATWRNRCRDVVEWGSKQTRGSNTYRNGSESTSLSGEAVRVAKEFAGHRNDRRA
jgi:uncharacterized protein YdaU (DUF1376 family)